MEESVVEFESYRVCLADSFVGRAGPARDGGNTGAGPAGVGPPRGGFWGKVGGGGPPTGGLTRGAGTPVLPRPALGFSENVGRPSNT